MGVDDPQGLLQRRRLWGVPPDAVAAWALRCTEERADLRAQVTVLEDRIARVQAERETQATEAAAARERIATLEGEKAEWKGRPETLRAEAVQFVVDAYAEAQAARDQSAQEIAAAREAADAEIAAQQAQARAAIAEERAHADTEMKTQRENLAAERQRLEADLATLRRRQAEAVAALDTLGRSLLAQFGRGDLPAPPPSPSPDVVAPNTATADAGETPTASAAPDTPDAQAARGDAATPEPADPPESAAAPEAPVRADTADAASPDNRAGMEDTVVSSAPSIAPSESPRPAQTEDAMLARALDELEAILQGNRKTHHENGGPVAAS